MAAERTRAVVERFPAPAARAPHETADWLADLPLPFLRHLRARHIELAQAWAKAVDGIATVRDQRSELEAGYRQSVPDAVTQGAAVPPRSEELAWRVSDGP